MKNKKFYYGLMCIVGAVSIGYFANKLNTFIGALMFSLGCIILVFSIIKLSK